MIEIIVYSLIIVMLVALVYFVLIKPNKNQKRLKYGDYEGRIKKLNIKISLNNRDALAYYERGIAYLKLNDKSAALKDLEMAVSLGCTKANTAIEMNHLNPLPYLNGNTRRPNIEYDHLKSEQYRDSLDDYDRVIKSNPQNSVAYFMRAEIKAIYKDHNGAIEDLTNAIKYNNKYSVAYFKRGEIKLKINDVESAKIDLDVASKLGFKKAASVLASLN